MPNALISGTELGQSITGYYSKPFRGFGAIKKSMTFLPLPSLPIWGGKQGRVIEKSLTFGEGDEEWYKFTNNRFAIFTK